MAAGMAGRLEAGWNPELAHGELVSDSHRGRARTDNFCGGGNQQKRGPVRKVRTHHVSFGRIVCFACKQF